MNKKLKMMIAVGLVVVVGGIGTFAVLNGNNPESKAKTTAVAKATGAALPEDSVVVKTDVSSNVYISGTVEANDTRNVSFMGGGNVDKVFIKVGDTVVPGQVLAKINSNKLDSEIKRLENELSIAQDELNKLKTRGTNNEESAVKTAQLNYDNAKKAYELNVSLQSSGAVSSDEVTKSKQQMELAAINLESAKISLTQANKKEDIAIKVKMMESTRIMLDNYKKDYEKTVIKAPIAGTVTNLNVKEGEVLPNDGILLTIDDLQKKIVKAQVSESEINRIVLGQEVVVTGSSIKGKSFLGEVTYIAPGTIRAQNSKSVKVEVKITLKDSVQELRPGFNVNLEVKTASKTGVLAVPFEAINTDEKGEKFVNVILPAVKGKEEEVKKVVITTGIEGDVFVEVASGDVLEGDKLQIQY